MTDIASLVSDNLHIWTAAIEQKSGAGRGGGKRISLYGIERLRSLILDLAVRGRLLPQDAEDEPAAILLKRVAQIRQSEAKGAKGESSNNTIGEKADALPSGWQIVRLDELANPQAGFAFKSKDFNEQAIGLPLIRIRDVGQPFTGTYFSGNYRRDFVVSAGDYLISMDGEFRVATWQGSDALLNQRVCRLQFYGEEVSRPYVAIALQMELTKLQGVKAYTTVDHLSGKQIADARIPLPPFAEQQRIVAKVDELLALCDALEAQNTSALSAHQTLVESLVATLTNCADATNLALNWAQIVSHFDTLFTTEASIDCLKQAVLELAVRGLLVGQQSDEGPLENPNGKWGKIASPPFPIPSNWQCLPLGALGEVRGGGTPSKARSDYWDGELPWVSPKDMKQDYLSDAQLHVSESALTGSAIKLIPSRSILFVVRGMILAHSFPVGIAKTNLTINQDMKALILHVPEMDEYLLRALKGLKREMLTRIKRSSHGTCRLDSKDYGSLPVPVPPLAEQKRIVAKVDELLALCDALKERIESAIATQKHLADAIVERSAA